MIPKNLHEQFLSRNHYELSLVIQAFHELMDIFPNRFALYLDSNGWEVFDMDFAKVVIRHKFKHLSAMRSDILELCRDFANIGACVSLRSAPKQKTCWSEKRLLRIYTEMEIYKMFPTYEQRKKAKAMADNH